MRVLGVLVLWSPLWAQGVSLGLRSGVLVTPQIRAEGPRQTSAARFTIGPCIEVHLWRGAGLGVDVLLRRTELAASAARVQRAGVWLWEMPATFIYRFRRPMGPFVRAGIAFNRVFDVSGATECARGPSGEQFYCLEGSALAELRHRSTSGFVLGCGLRLRWKKLWLEPEVRLTHWADRNFGVRDSAVRSELNQAGLLLGVVF